MSEQFANLASSTLASAYTAGSGSITLANAAGFPTSGTFTVAIRDQASKAIKLLFRVTSVSGAVFTGASEGADAAANSGDLVDGTILTAAALAQMKTDWATPATSYVPSLLTEDKSSFGGVMNNSKTEYQTVNASATQVILNYTGGQPGYIADIWLAIHKQDAAGWDNANIKITIDGESVPAINLRLPLFFCGEYLPDSGGGTYFNRFVSGNLGAGLPGVAFRHPIPFNSSAKIEVTNGSGANSIVLFAEVNYVTGVSNAWPRTKKLWCSSGTLTNQTVNTVETLVNATGLNQGRLLGLYLSIDSFPNSANPATAPLEGNVKFYFDGAGSPNYESSGTEDYFHSSNYFQNSNQGFGNEYTCYQFIAGSTWNAFRWHITDPMMFSNALKVTWNCGDSTQVNFSGGVRLAYCVFYYTE